MATARPGSTRRIENTWNVFSPSTKAFIVKHCLSHASSLRSFPWHWLGILAIISACNEPNDEWPGNAALPALPQLSCDVQFIEAEKTPTVHATVAITPNETSRGLMFREEPLGESHGMLFALRDQRVQVFHMKNTYIPLDMIFINENFRVVGIVENATPKTKTPRRVNAQSRYVLEVDSGWCQRHGVRTGQSEKFSKFTPVNDGSTTP
mgnify:CR=1 FL=1